LVFDQVVFEYAKDRPILFSSFQPDAAQLMRKLQGTYPVSELDTVVQACVEPSVIYIASVSHVLWTLLRQVYFLTNGGTELYADVRRNSLEEAVKLCLAGGLQGIVSEARGIFRHPAAVPKIKEANLSLLTYGTLK
jgi:glycerophosphodiester phosphodiesterase